MFLLIAGASSLLERMGFCSLSCLADRLVRDVADVLALTRYPDTVAGLLPGALFTALYAISDSPERDGAESRPPVARGEPESSDSPGSTHR